MYKITCDYCFEANYFDDPANQPEFCSNCNSPLGHLTPEEISDIELAAEKSMKIPNGFTLTYEKTGETIEVSHNEIIILGRQNIGKDILEKIPQISREHCKIEFYDNRYLVTDLNSLNGTYLGITKRDCLKHTKQELNDGEVLFLGREPFKIRLNYLKETKQNFPSHKNNENDLPAVKFKCKACGKIHDMNLMICDNCGSYGQIERIDESSF
jgi:hypothetical protein